MRDYSFQPGDRAKKDAESIRAQTPRRKKFPNTRKGETRYSVVLLFEYCVTVGKRLAARRICEERIILVYAPNARAALARAKEYGKNDEIEYENTEGNRVRFRFVGVLDMIDSWGASPEEVWYTIRQYVRPMERRKSILPKESELSAFLNEDVERENAAKQK